MGMLGTLAKVAIGIAVAKGVGSMMKNRSGGGQGMPGSTGGGGLQDMMGDLLRGGQPGGAGQQTGGQAGGQGGSLQDMMGDILSGGRRSGQTGQSGGLGDILEKLGGSLGGGAGGSGGGGLGDLIGGLAKGQTRGGGGALGEVFGEFLGNKQQSGSSSGDGAFGDIFNEALANGGEPEVEPSREQEAAAALMLKAMIQAAKSDGRIDEAEQAKLMDNLGDVSPEERRFVEQEMAAPVDAAALAAQVPVGMEQQVYLMALMGIDLDNRSEAEFLHTLATEMQLDRDTVNAVHDQIGAIRLYS